VSSAPPPDLTSRVLRRERTLVAGSVALLTAFGWWYILTRAVSPTPMAAMPGPPVGALIIMWWLMMVAMMLPSAAPAILLYARVREMRSRDAAIAQTWLFVGGYLAVWLLFSMAAAVGQALLTGPSMALGSRVAQGAVLVTAGLYQLSPLKSACLSQCRSPAQFIARYWRAGWTGTIRLGLRHAAYCLGCCWMLMLLLFVGGVMNLLWVIGLTAIVAVEKLVPRGDWLGRGAGVALVLWGAIAIAGY
jgi:predicted metal-binding membrane protein